MTSFNLKEYIKQKQLLVEAELLKYVPKNGAFPSRIFESMNYSLMAGGKRIRPVLSMAGHEVCGGNQNDVLPLACAFEMIHTFSLIHDDLPAMDDDDLRRGNPTNHKVFGEAIAILAGDGLHSMAFEVLGLLSQKVFKPERIIEVISDVARATGPVGMVGGQLLDIEAEGRQLTADELATLHRLKTGRLIEGALMTGAKLATENQTKLKALAIYGQAIGLAFQVADDILDIEGENTGKDIGSDIENNKMTYVTLLGLEGAKAEAQKLEDKAIDALSVFGDEANPLRALATYIVKRRN